MLPSHRINGRNNSGKISVFHRGNGVKKKKRIVDLKRSILNVFGIVKRFEYDPKRSCFLALIFYYKLFLFSYILLPSGLRLGDSVISSIHLVFGLGNACPLSSMCFGSPIHNIEICAGKGGQLIRAAGLKAFVLSKHYKLSRVKLNKKRIVILRNNVFITIGQVSNLFHIYKNLRKGGITRLMGFRPIVRGVAMNPIDHPHGGGEGKTSGGRVSVSPWGKLTKGPKTRKGFFSLIKKEFVS